MRISRREFLKVSGSSIGVLLSRAGHAGTLRRRKEILLLSSSELTTYRAGVEAMKALLRDNPLSWDYQRAVHWIWFPTQPGGVADPAGVASYWRQCRHGDPHFFSWHRWQLLYWEEMCRQLSGSTSFNLPYWDYLANGFLPDAFKAPGAGQTNSLYHANRNADINSGAAQLNTVASSQGWPLLALDGFSESNFFNFSDAFEGNPHGLVHVAVGGDMGLVETSAIDPIFWLHHANIDRYWVEWLRQGGGRTNPTQAGWLAQTFNFQTVAGPRAPRAGDALTTDGLGYTYDKPKIPPFDKPAAILELLRALRTRYRFPKPRVLPLPPKPPKPGPDPAPWTLLSRQAGIKLDGIPTVMPVPKEAPTVKTLGQALAGRDIQIAVTLHGIRAEKGAELSGYIYQVFLVPSIKELAAGKIDEAAQIGLLSSFSVSAATVHQEHKHNEGARVVLRIMDPGRKILAKSLAEDPGIVFVRRSTLVDRNGKEFDANRDRVLFTFEELRLEMRRESRAPR